MHPKPMGPQTRQVRDCVVLLNLYLFLHNWSLELALIMRYLGWAPPRTPAWISVPNSSR